MVQHHVLLDSIFKCKEWLTWVNVFIILNLRQAAIDARCKQQAVFYIYYKQAERIAESPISPDADSKAQCMLWRYL